jgi:hypothetical protein
MEAVNGPVEVIHQIKYGTVLLSQYKLSRAYSVDAEVNFLLLAPLKEAVTLFCYPQTCWMDNKIQDPSQL